MILSQAGQVYVLVNNAGIGIMGAVEELPIAAIRASMETNFLGAVRCIQAVVPGMRSRRSGCIVNITSIGGRFSSAPEALYTSSKFALEEVSECLAQEMKTFGVRVDIVEPNVIATPIFGKAQPLPDSTNYPHTRRINELFRASLENPVSPYVVGEKIREIVDRRFPTIWQCGHHLTRIDSCVMPAKPQSAVILTGIRDPRLSFGPFRIQPTMNPTSPINHGETYRGR